MEKNTLYLYESPQVEIVEVEVEQGFAGSFNTEGLDEEENL